MYRFASLFEHRRDVVRVVRADNQNEPDAHVENAPHFFGGDVAGFLEPAEDGRHGPGVPADFGAEPFGEDARDVARNPAARDVGHAMHDPLALVMIQDTKHRPRVKPRRLEQLVGHPDAEAGNLVAHRQPRRLEHDLADEAVTVGVDAARGQAEDDVAGGDARAVDDAFLLDDADGKAGEVEILRGVKSGEFGRLAAQKGTVARLTRLGHADDHLRQRPRFQTPRAEVIQKEERLGTERQNVVDAHRDTVLTDGAIAAGIDGDAQFRPDAVRAGYQERVPVIALEDSFIVIEAEDAGKMAVLVRDARTVGPLDGRLDLLDECVAGLDVHTGVLVGEGFGHWGVSSGRPVILPRSRPDSKHF